MSIYSLKSRFQAILRPAVRRLHALGVTANQVTIAACLISIALGVYLMQAPPRRFILVPIWMFLRMAFNAIDGMLAREFHQRSHLGAYLNELTDVISDAALYLPFGFAFGWPGILAIVFLAAVSEMTGVVAVMTGASRRYDGPMGKSDRAFVFSLLALWIAFFPLPPWRAWIAWIVAALVAVTIVNRMRAGLKEVRA